MKKNVIKALIGVYVSVSILIIGFIFYVLNWNGYTKIFITAFIIAAGTFIYFIRSKRSVESKT